MRVESVVAQMKRAQKEVEMDRARKSEKQSMNLQTR